MHTARAAVNGRAGLGGSVTESRKNKYNTSNDPVTTILLVRPKEAVLKVGAPGPAGSSIPSPQSWSETRILRPHPRPTRSGTLGWGSPRGDREAGNSPPVHQDAQECP